MTIRKGSEKFSVITKRLDKILKITVEYAKSSILMQKQTDTLLTLTCTVVRTWTYSVSYPVRITPASR